MSHYKEVKVTRSHIGGCYNLSEKPIIHYHVVPGVALRFKRNALGLRAVATTHVSDMMGYSSGVGIRARLDLRLSLKLRGRSPLFLAKTTQLSSGIDST